MPKAASMILFNLYPKCLTSLYIGL